MCCCRTPQVVRAAARVYIILLVPLFYGPYYAQVRQESDSFAFALFFAIIVSSSKHSCTCGCIQQLPSKDHSTFMSQALLLFMLVQLPAGLKSRGTVGVLCACIGVRQ